MPGKADGLAPDRVGSAAAATATVVWPAGDLTRLALDAAVRSLQALLVHTHDPDFDAVERHHLSRAQLGGLA